MSPQKIEGLPREMIALRVSREIQDGMYVNLGIGIPTLVSNWIEGKDVYLQAEVGMLKTGALASAEESDQDLINASCQAVTALPGSSFFDIAESFAMIRGGHIDCAVMGALQINDKGDYAGWSNPTRGLFVGNVGGSMDLCAGARKLIIAMEHTTKDGEFKIVKKLSYPATAEGKVSLLITDLAVIEITPKGMVLKEVMSGLTAADVQSVTEPKLIIPKEGVKEMQL